MSTSFLPTRRDGRPGHRYHGLNVLNPTHLLNAFGALAPIGLALILFAETGILVGIILPGDSLLFTAGLLSATHRHGDVHLNLGLVLVAAFVGAVIGAQTGFVLGRRAGPRLFNRPDSRFFKQQYVGRTGDYLERYGPAKAVILARFIPVVRTLMNPLVGVADMDGRVFTAANIAGGFVWTVGIVLAGFFLGKSVPNIDHYILPIIAAIVALSLVPVGIEVRRSRRERTEKAARDGREPAVERQP
jgi:membrane-associated protein